MKISVKVSPLFLIAVVVSATIISGGSSYGQSNQPTTTINLTAEQRHVLKENLLKDPNVSKVPDDTSVSIGSTVPSSISVTPVVREKVSQVKSHGFFVKGDAIVLVDTQTNTIDAVID